MALVKLSARALDQHWAGRTRVLHGQFDDELLPLVTYFEERALGLRMQDIEVCQAIESFLPVKCLRVISQNVLILEDGILVAFSPNCDFLRSPDMTLGPGHLA